MTKKLFVIALIVLSGYSFLQATTLYVPATYPTIQAAVAVSVNGDLIQIANGSYNLTSTLNLDHEITIIGESEAGVIINATGTPSGDCAINLNKSNTSLSNLTILPNGTDGGYPIHVGDDMGYAVIYNVSLSHITIDNAWWTAFDFNGVTNLALSYLTATNSGYGNGIQVSGCTNVTVNHITTSNNALGGFAVYVSKESPEGVGRGSDNVNIDGTSCSFSELAKIYYKNENGFFNTNISATGFDYLVKNINYAGYVWYQRDMTKALIFAGAPPFYNSSVKQISTGQYWVSPGVNIQAAVNAAASGDIINVAAGTYDGFSIVGKSNLTIQGAGVGSTIINPTTLITTDMGHKYTNPYSAFVFVNNSTNIIIKTMTIESNLVTPGSSGGGDAIVFWNASTGQINNSEVKGMYTISGMQTGQGIAVDAGSGQITALAVTNTAINGFQENGIDAVDGNGSTSNAGTITLTVNGCTITGAGPTAAITQNGVLVWKRGGGSVTGSVDLTTFANLWYSPSGDTACGVLAYDDISIHNSFFNSVQIGVKNNTSPVVIIDATENWWGDPTGPYNASSNISGKGVVVSDNVLFMPTIAVALPVELSSFTSITNGRNVQLNWETKTEKNSDKFVIEREVSGANWEAIGSVKAAVLSNSPKQYSFTDNNLQSGKYQYRLKMVDNDGSFSYSSIEAAEVTVPHGFAVSQNYPNPFNPSTKIDYQVPVDAKVILEVYNIAGQKVVELVNKEQSAGYYTVDFGASNLSSGVYIYRLAASNKATGINFSSIKKMMLLK
jgi:hypothetical protein